MQAFPQMLRDMPCTNPTQAVENNPVSVAPSGGKMPLLPDNWFEIRVPSPRWICLERLSALHLPWFEIGVFLLLDGSA